MCILLTPYFFYKQCIIQHLERKTVCTPLSVNIFVTLALQQHLEYLCKLFLKHPVSIYIYKKKYVCVCVRVCPGITLERLERFRPNLVHILLYVCVRILCMFYTYSAERMVWKARNLGDSHC
jgi:hypothetical protein